MKVEYLPRSGCFYRLVWVEWKLCSEHSVLRWICEHRSRSQHRRKGEMGRFSCDVEFWCREVHRGRILGRWVVDSGEWRALRCRVMKKEDLKRCVCCGEDLACVVSRMGHNKFLKERETKLSCGFLCLDIFLVQRVQKMVYFNLWVSSFPCL